MSKDTISVNMNVYDIPIVVEQLKKLEQENKHLNLQLDQALKDYEELLIKIDKAIEYIKENSYIVQDKELNGIPLMSKRLDKCYDLLKILGDKEND